MFEEKEVEVDQIVGDGSNECLILLPTEDGANATFPATPLPLGKKVVTEGREKGLHEGEGWRLAVLRKRQCSVATEACEARLCSLANNLNAYFLKEPPRMGLQVEGSPGVWVSSFWRIGPTEVVLRDIVWTTV